VHVREMSSDHERKLRSQKRDAMKRVLYNHILSEEEGER